MTDKSTAFAKLRTDLDVAITRARQSGIDSRLIGEILERQAALSREHFALTAPTGQTV
jgi:hypothetical protein